MYEPRHFTDKRLSSANKHAQTKSYDFIVFVLPRACACSVDGLILCRKYKGGPSENVELPARP
jgi:hypothetical protein